MDKAPKLPKESLVDPEGGLPRDDGSEDVEGHGLPVTAPPSFLGSRQPGHGGENIPSPVEDEGDVEGHKRP